MSSNHSHKHGGAGHRSSTRPSQRSKLHLPNKFNVLLKVTKFLNKVKANGINVKSELLKVDPNSTGTTSKAAFQKTLSSLGLTLKEEELNHLTQTNNHSSNEKISYHGLIMPHKRRLSTIEVSELGKSTTEIHRKSMTAEELTFAEELCVLFNLIDTTPSPDPNPNNKADASARHHLVHRNDILKQLKSKTSHAWEYAHSMPSLKPLLNTASYESSLYAYVTLEKDDFIDVDEFVDFWFHHIPDHVQDHLIKAKDGFYETHDQHSVPIEKKIEDHHEFAIQIRLFSCQNLRKNGNDANTSNPYVVLNSTPGGSTNSSTITTDGRLLSDGK
jgi:hypothetical protein